MNHAYNYQILAATSVYLTPEAELLVLLGGRGQATLMRDWQFPAHYSHPYPQSCRQMV